jgi:hypothetical protein
LCGWGSCKSPPESEYQVCTHSRLVQLRKKRSKSKKEPMAFLKWCFGLTRMTTWRIEVAPVSGLSNVATPTRPIITIPITLYRYGNGDDAEEGGPERRRDGREHGEYKRDKERCRCEARCAYLFPNVFRCSFRTAHPALLKSRYSSTHHILAAIARTSESVDAVLV